MKIIKGLFFFTTVFLLVLCLIWLISVKVFSKPKDQLISPLIQTVRDKEQQIFSLFASNLDKKIQQAMKNVDGTYSIVVTNLTTGENYSQNPDKKYYSASLYKLWLMAATYQELKNGSIQKDDSLKASIPELNDAFDIASDEAELTEGDIDTTVEEALTKAITVSDNYSALILTKKIGASKLSAFLQQEGLTNSKIGSPPTTTASDIAKFYLKLYKRELIDEESSDEMIDLLKRQALNDRIPKYLPEEIQVAHKTGELYGYKHDAGIVFTPDGDYILVVLSNTKNPTTAADQIANLSEIIYEYFKEATKD